MKGISIAGAAILALGLTETATAAPADLLPPKIEHVTGSGQYVSFDADMTVGDLETFYKQALPKHGWQLEPGSHMGEAIFYVIEPKAGRGGSVLMLPNSRGTHVTLVLPLT
jgi:hypothetical protein